MSSVPLSGDSGELFLFIDISCILRTNEISLQKNNNEPGHQTMIDHKLVLVFMPYHFCYGDINV